MFRKKSNHPKATAIIVAAGSSRRMGDGTNKQFILINNTPVLAHTLLNFEKAEAIDRIIIVTKPDAILTVSDLVHDYSISKVSDIIPGGETRQDSVRCGLALTDPDTLVAVHDGARPFISVEKINQLVDVASQFGAAAPGVVPKDTVKTISSDTISDTLDRETLRLIQTPQVFKADNLINAYLLARNQGFVGTDDCSVAENAGIPIRVINGEYTNIKVTTPEDIPMAEAIFSFLNK